jgi:hypothetical protein
MQDTSVISDLFKDTIETLYNEYIKEGNKERIDCISNDLFDTFFKRIQVYFALLVVILLVLIVLNFVQFYYYIKVFMRQIKTSDKSAIIKDIFSS